ncbi:MAG TPA: class I SAM-dependent methyltransferase [Patescibacteria group bacterium]|nr:class I SAM-dependent methyltransferase [Patescibacteria group bacterium]
MQPKVKTLSSVAGYNLAAEYYDEKEKYLNSFENNKVLELLGDVQGKKVLDIGAGTGRLTLQLAKRGAEVTAVDISEEMLKKLRSKNEEVRIVIADAEDLPFDNDAFDIVVSAFLVVHLKDPTRFFDEVYRVLKDGGTFLVTNINQKDPPKVKTRQGEIIIESHYHRPKKIREILESLAFGIEQEVFVKEGETWVNQIIVCKK